MNITLHHSMARLNRYKKQNEEQRIKVTNIALPAVNNVLPKQILANEEEVNTDQNKTSKIPFNETTNIISSDNTSIKKRSSELQLGEKR
ncbi:11229_t:CDS:2, partial [Scutellospora calospora]